MDEGKIKYYLSIPESDTVASLNGALLMTMKAHPEWFYDDFKIDSAYGCPRGCIWNGNREFDGNRCTWEEVASIIRSYKDFGITYRLTFTNFLLEEKHLSDEYGNMIAHVAEIYSCSVEVTNSTLKEYLKAKYIKLDVIEGEPKGVEDIKVKDGAQHMVIPGQQDLLQCFTEYLHWLVRAEYWDDFWNSVNAIWWQMLLKAGMAKKDVYAGRRQLINELDYKYACDWARSLGAR